MTNKTLTEMPLLNIDNKEYKMSRLSINKAFKFLGLINELGVGKIQGYINSYAINKENGVNEETAIAAIILNLLSDLGDAEKTFYEIIGMLLDINEKDAKELPIEAIIEIYKGIKEHPDLEVFLQSVKSLSKKK